MPEQKTAGPMVGIIRLIGLLVVFVTLFVGLIYTFRGNFMIAAGLALLSLIAFERLSYYLLHFKTRKQPHKNYTPEIVVGMLYFSAFCVAFPPSFHFIDVDFNRKEAIKNSGENKLRQIQNLNESYNAAIQTRLDRFKTDVQSDLTAYFLAKGSEKQLYKNKLGELLGRDLVNARFFESHEISPSDMAVRDRIRRELEPAVRKKQDVQRSSLSLDSQLDREWREEVQNAKLTFKTWNFFEVSRHYNNLDLVYKKVFEAAKAKVPELDVPAEMQGDPVQIDQPLQSVSNAGILSILAVCLLLVLFHVCILLPYLLESRPIVPIKPNEGPYTNKGAVDLTKIK
jgi:hypothetical protein